MYVQEYSLQYCWQLLNKINSWVRWCAPIVPATRKAKAGRFHESKHLRLVWAKQQDSVFLKNHRRTLVWTVVLHWTQQTNQNTVIHAEIWGHQRGTKLLSDLWRNQEKDGCQLPKQASFKQQIEEGDFALAFKRKVTLKWLSCYLFLTSAFFSLFLPYKASSIP